MKELIYNRKITALATAITVGSSALIASCAAPAGTHSVGRVLSHEIVTKSGIKLQQFPHNRASIPLVAQKEVNSYLITIRNCGTMTPPTEEKLPGCTDRVFNDKTLYDQYVDGALVEFNRERVIGEFVLPQVATS